MLKVDFYIISQVRGNINLKKEKKKGEKVVFQKQYFIQNNVSFYAEKMTITKIKNRIIRI